MYSLWRGNVEFIYYTAVLVLSIAVILTIHRRMHFYPVVLIGLSFLGLMHLLGGNIDIGVIRLYDYFIIPGLLKYDNVVHMFGTAIMVMLAYTLLEPILHDSFERRHHGYFIILLVLVGMGLGSINEIIEFFAVLMFNVGQWVGDYRNTLLDLIFNTIGATIMSTFLVKTHARLNLNAADLKSIKK